MTDPLFLELMESAQEAAAFAHGDTSRCRVVRCTDPVPEYTAQDVVRIRDALGMDRVGFALLMGVSSRTVQAWETGRGGLKGPVRRLPYLLEDDPALVERLGFGERLDYTKWQQDYFDGLSLDTLLEAAYAWDSAHPIRRRPEQDG